MYIFTVTTIPNHPDDPRSRAMFPRTWGWYPTFEEAMIGLSQCDMKAGYYNVAVIEKVSQGIYPVITEMQWYQCERDFEWEECQKPSNLAQTVHFSMS